MAKRRAVKAESPVPQVKTVEYFPPSAPEIERYVGEVCTRLADIDVELNTPEVRHELTKFVRVIAGLCAKIYTRHGKLLDTNPE